MPRIAVIIPTYNRSELLKAALDSVLSQKYKDLETIVVDDGSEDDTSELVGQYPQCRYIKLEHSGLPAVARNAGIRRTKADFVAFLDSDDEWLPQKLERQMPIFAEADAGLVCSNAFSFLTARVLRRGPISPPNRARRAGFSPILSEITL